MAQQPRAVHVMSARRLLLAALVVAVGALPLATAPVGGGGGGASFDEPEMLGVPPVREFSALPEAGGARYYRIELTKGEAVRALLAVMPADFAPNALPGLLVAAPGLPTQPPPESVDLPEGVGFIASAPGAPHAQLRAWWPARVHVVLDTTFVAPADGAYTFVLHDGVEGGRVALLLGEGDASWTDWFRMPGVRADARAWQGAPAWSTYAWGLAGALVVLGPLALLRRTWPWAVPAALSVGAAGLAGASGGVSLADAARMAEPPLEAFAPGAVGLLVGFALVLLGVLRPGGERVTRVATAVVAVVAVVTFVGFLWGPVAALVACVMPAERVPEEARG